MDYFKIRNKDGLYSTGGVDVAWNRTGKIWPLPQLKSHLTMIASGYKSLAIYKDCVLVRFSEVDDTSTDSVVLRDLIEPHEKQFIIDRLKGLK